MTMQPMSGGITRTPSFDNVTYSTVAGTPTYAEGRTYWDSTDHTLALMSDVNGATLQVGQENWVRVTNKTGSTLTDGAVVYVSGAQGNRPTAALADADIEVTAYNTLGVVTYDIANNAEGYVTTFGLVRNVNTSTFTAGDDLYVSPTPGQLTNVRPAWPAHAVRVARALNSTTNGMIFVTVDNGDHLANLHDVNFTGLATNDYLKYDGSKWINSPSASSVSWGGIVGTLSSQTDLNSALTARALTATTLTAGTGLTGGGDLSANRTFAVNFGTSATTVCVGDDARLSNSRTPVAHDLDGALHTISGKTAGQVVVATSPTTYAFTSVGGDATLSGAGILTVSGNAIGNSKLAQAAANTIKGNNSGVTSNVTDLTADQVVTMLPLATTTSKGLLQQLPSSGGTGVFLRGDGTWQAV